MSEDYESPDEFWQEREEQKGGKVAYRSFAVFIGSTDTGMSNLPGLVYIINGILYFEDFEKENFLFKIISRKKKWQKTEFSIVLSNVAEVKLVSKESAIACIGGNISTSETKTLSKFRKMFAKAAIQVHMQSGYSLFLEIMEQSGFISAVQKEMGVEPGQG
jgi:hypothetical protein